MCWTELKRSVQEVSPAEEGWYWCQADTRTSVLFVAVVSGVTGTADQLTRYSTYSHSWQDRQEGRSRLLRQLERVIAQYLRPVRTELGKPVHNTACDTN